MTQEIDQYRNKILQGDCLAVLKTLPSNSIQMCVTSPPYFNLREYGTAKWEGGDTNCDHMEINSLRRDSPGGFHNSEARGTQPNTVSVQKQYHDICAKCGAKRIDAQIGHEKTPEQFVKKIVEIFEEVRRVLRKDGVCFLNMGDTYWGSNGFSRATPDFQRKGRNDAPSNDRTLSKNTNLKTKDLCLVPQRLEIALQDAGWWIRNDLQWVKPNCIPFPVTDRFVNCHEVIIYMTKSAKCFFDVYAVKEPTVKDSSKVESHPFGKKGGKIEQLNDRRLSGTEWTNTGLRNKRDAWYNNDDDELPTELQWIILRLHEIDPEIPLLLHKDYMEQCGNKTDAWRVTVKGTKEVHFAVFPQDLIEPCILAGTSDRGACAICGAPYKRIVVKEIDHLDPVDPIERHGVTLTPEDSAKVLWIEKTGGDYRISVIGDKHSHMWMDEPTKSGRTTQLKEKGYTLIWWGVKEGLKSDNEWKDKCGADSNGEYNGVSEKFLKQDALGKATQTGFNKRWKEKQQNASDVKRRILEGMVGTKTVDWEPTCACYNNKQKGVDIGQSPQSFIRDDKIAVLRAKSREDAVKMYPDDAEKQKEYIKYVHDHGCSDPATQGKTVAWSASCACDASEIQPCIVLDPFMGSGTTAIVAQKFGRDYIGIELNPEYITMAERRIKTAKEELNKAKSKNKTLGTF